MKLIIRPAAICHYVKDGERFLFSTAVGLTSVTAGTGVKLCIQGATHPRTKLTMELCTFEEAGLHISGNVGATVNDCKFVGGTVNVKVTKKAECIFCVCTMDATHACIEVRPRLQSPRDRRHSRSNLPVAATLGPRIRPSCSDPYA